MNISIPFFISFLLLLSILFIPSPTIAAPYATTTGYIFDSQLVTPGLLVTGSLRIGSTINSIDVTATLLALDHRITMLNDQLNNMTALLNNVNLQLQDTNIRLSDAEDQNIYLNGLITSANNRINTLSTDVDTLSTDVDIRIANDELNSADVAIQLKKAQDMIPGSSTLVDTLLYLQLLNGTGTGGAGGVSQVVGLIQSNISTNVRISNLEQTVMQICGVNGQQIIALQQSNSTTNSLLKSVEARVNAAELLTGSSALVAAVNSASSITYSAITANRNRIINGAFALDTTHNGAFIYPAPNAIQIADSWWLGYSAGVGFFNSFGIQRVMGGDSPIGTNTYITISVSNALTAIGSNYAAILQYIPWSTLNDLQWGTVNAQSLILSFQVRVKFPGLYGGSFRNNAFTRTFPFTWTVLVANTWQKISVIISSETESSSWSQTNLTDIAGNLIFSLLRGPGGSVPPYSSTNTWINADSHSTVGQTNFAQMQGGYYDLASVQLFSASAAFDYRLSVDTYELTSPSSSLINIAQSAFTGNSVGKNCIHNAQFSVDQRAVYTQGNGILMSLPNARVMDRWLISIAGLLNTITAEQSPISTVIPNGFSNYLGFTVTTADNSIGSGDYIVLHQYVEYNSVSDLGWGSSDASPVTLTFHVRSSITGQFGGSIRHTSLQYTFPFAYMINTANTWQLVTISIPGPTSILWTIPTDPSSSVLDIVFTLASGISYSAPMTSNGNWTKGNFLTVIGQTNFTKTIGNTFYITGVQLEKGNIPTSFDWLNYGTDLQQCQRYLYVVGRLTVADSTAYPCNTYIYINANDLDFGPIYFPVPMRSVPPGANFQSTGSSDVSINNGAVLTGWTWAQARPTKTFAYVTGHRSTPHLITTQSAILRMTLNGDAFMFSAEF
jgi:hypothetical protein